MSILSVKIPAINESFYSPTDARQVAGALDSIYERYGTFINKASKLSNVPVDLITSFIFIESGGKENVRTTGVEAATGLMQVTPALAYDIYSIEKRNKRLTADEQAAISKFVPLSTFAKSYSTVKATIADALKKPEFNIIMGTIALGYLIDINKSNGKARLDKVVVQYNQGLYSRTTKTDWWKKDSVEQLYTKLNSVSKAYVKKLLGVRGTLDLLV